MDNLLRAYIDGVASIATHNGVHRIRCFQYTPDGTVEPTLELIVPAAAAAAVAEAFSKLVGEASPPPEEGAVVEPVRTPPSRPGQREGGRPRAG